MLNFYWIRILGGSEAAGAPWTAPINPPATGDPLGLLVSLAGHPVVGAPTRASREAHKALHASRG